ncbi:MAG: conjugal transfer protein TrbL family protein [Dysosmobacter welbionis]
MSLIVALLNGAIAYIDGLMEGIVPLTLYAEEYMSTLAGVDLFEALFDIVFWLWCVAYYSEISQKGL